MHASIPNAEATSAACGVASHALVQATLAEIPGLREKPSPEGMPSLPPRFLRHCDEQTVVGMRAVLAAMADYPEPRPSFADFGVVAAPCQAGRFATAQSLAMLRTAGGVAVSPHIVPQCSLHSVAGAVSVAFGLHGPNIGVGGGQHAVSEGLLASLSFLTADASLPGIWLVVSGWSEEPSLDASGKPACESLQKSGTVPICRALAVAITAHTDIADNTAITRRLTLHMPAAIRMARPVAEDRRAADEILEFARALDAPHEVSWSHTCPWGTEICLRSRLAAAAHGTQAASRDTQAASRGVPHREAA